MSLFDGIGSAIGGVVSGVTNYFSQRETNSMNKDLARENREFDLRNANNAHQREVADLKAAGLNPNLSAGGNGSATPGSNAPQMQAPQIQLPDFMAYGISLKQLEQADQRLAIDKANSAAGIAKNLTEQDLNKAKKILYQKGMIRADLEGEASGVLKNIIKFLKDGATKQKSPYSTEDAYKKSIDFEKQRLP